jgi:hypothetical protein
VHEGVASRRRSHQQDQVTYVQLNQQKSGDCPAPRRLLLGIINDMACKIP